MRTMKIILMTVVAAFALAPAALAQSPGSASTSYVGQMSEEQIRQKLAGEGFSSVTDLKRITVTRYRWIGKALRSGKQMDVTVDEFGHVSAK
jgi:hypothetical protein